ncbi:hypothetical protein SAMN05444481_12071 [Flavobacterium frigidimaris]|jgi:hypothetical protein|nr:hypothetical protein SAMN05444481_12071 [Flavobacterium frigidimaris]
MVKAKTFLFYIKNSIFEKLTVYKLAKIHHYEGPEEI